MEYDYEDDRDETSPEEFSETPAGYRARDRWAERCYETDGPVDSSDY
jgi:hypothetical protein